MIIKSIRLRGFRGFRSGIGLDEVFLDLSSLPGGLVAITGMNGAGKTTLLDNLHPYRIQPFKIRKAKDWSPGAFSYYDQVSGSDACKELVFEMGGVMYKSLILIDADRRKQECYLYRSSKYPGVETIMTNDGPRQNAVPGWEPLNDGKTKTYDEAVEKVCGSPSLFFTSVFRCQGAKNLSDYTRGDIMQIISELLNIDHIREQADKCRVVVNGLSAGLATVRSKIADIQKESETVTALQHSIAERDADIARDHLLLDDARGKLEATRSLIASLKGKKAAQESERSRLELLNSQLADEQKRLRDAETTCLKSVADLTKKMNDAQAAHDRFKADLTGKVARAEKIVSGGEAIRQAVLNEADLVAHVEQLKAGLSVETVDRDRQRSVVSTIEKELAVLLAEIKSVEASVAKLDGLDCHGDNTGWLNPHCKFIADAVAGKEKLPGLLVRRDTLRGGKEVAEKELAAAVDRVNETDRLLLKAETDLQECRKFTRLLPELEQAEANLSEWRQALEAREKEVECEIKTLDGEKWYAESEWDIARGRISRTIAELEAKIAEVPTGVDIDLMLRGAAVTETAELSAVNGYEARIREAELAVSGLKAKLEISRGRLAEADDLVAQAARYDAEIAKFALLHKACSNDGIIALEIDDSGSGISAIANELLSSCYGARFSICFETQRQKQDGAAAETFDVIVHDSLADQPRSLTEMSGGQAAWINDALTRAICLFNIQSRGKQYGTLFADEVDGALDSNRKLEFLSVKRKALDIGTHTREFFISQSPELIDMADAQIVLSAGSVSIVQN